MIKVSEDIAVEELNNKADQTGTQVALLSGRKSTDASSGNEYVR